jgi:hypothetical protein
MRCTTDMVASLCALPFDEYECDGMLMTLKCFMKHDHTNVLFFQCVLYSWKTLKVCLLSSHNDQRNPFLTWLVETSFLDK